MPDGSVMHVRYCLDDKLVWRVGYGAMQLAGDGVFGPPRDGDMASRCYGLRWTSGWITSTPRGITGPGWSTNFG